VNTPLTDVPLIDLLWRVRTVALPMPGLIAVPARTVGRWSLGIVGTRFTPRKSNGVTLAETRLGLILLHRLAIPLVSSWSTDRWSSCHWSLGLRCPCPGFKSPLASLGRSVYSVIVLLSESITDKLIESCTLSMAHSLQQLGAKTLFEASNLLRLSVHKLRSIPRQMIESMKILLHSFVALS